MRLFLIFIKKEMILKNRVRSWRESTTVLRRTRRHLTLALVSLDRGHLRKSPREFHICSMSHPPSPSPSPHQSSPIRLRSQEGKCTPDYGTREIYSIN